MNRKQALSMYLLGTFGQVLGVSLLVWLLRAGGAKVDFTSPMGIIAVVLGGLSSAFWGSLASISYHQSSFKQLLKDFFQVKDSLANYCLVLVFLLLDFFPSILGGKITTQSLVLPVVLFFKALLFGGIEEIGWRYFFQPTLWICVMTHACINALSQILVNEEVWLSLVSKILIISLAIMIARKKYITLKEEK